MKCNICGKKTTWDESYGRESFIVCPRCHDKLAEDIERWIKIKPVSSKFITSSIIIEIGRIKEEGK